MSGDSPSSHATDTIFDFKEGRQSPIPTTSKESTSQPQNFVTASVLVEKPPKRDEEKEQESCLFNSPLANNTCEVNNEHGNDESTLKLNSTGGGGGGGGGFDGDKKDEQRKLNGPSDMLDGKWIPAQDATKNEKDEEECAVKCLYYTMQCCECTIL